MTGNVCRHEIVSKVGDYGGRMQSGVENDCTTDSGVSRGVIYECDDR